MPCIDHYKWITNPVQTTLHEERKLSSCWSRMISKENVHEDWPYKTNFHCRMVFKDHKPPKKSKHKKSLKRQTSKNLHWADSVKTTHKRTPCGVEMIHREGCKKKLKKHWIFEHARKKCVFTPNSIFHIVSHLSDRLEQASHI